MLAKCLMFAGKPLSLYFDVSQVYRKSFICAGGVFWKESSPYQVKYLFLQVHAQASTVPNFIISYLLLYTCTCIKKETCSGYNHFLCHNMHSVITTMQYTPSNSHPVLTLYVIYFTNRSRGPVWLYVDFYHSIRSSRMKMECYISR